jgi:hypothetical protein
MSIERTLIDIALQLKKSFEARQAGLRRELQELETRKAVIQAEMALADNSDTRLAQYQPGSMGDNKCPYCWMITQTLSPLYPIGGGTRDEDHFRCSNCKEVITVRLLR